MDNRADIILPFCPRCGARMVSLTTLSNERIEFACDAAAARSVLWPEDLSKPFKWTRACGSLIRLMNLPSGE